jgi:pantoate--beta-alanine ligase
MIIVKEARLLRGLIAQARTTHTLIGFVPTMGALHQGHLALVATCKQQSQLTVCSIFVNPTQFNNASDFQKYPNTLEKDITLLEAAGVDILFLPPVAEIYPQGMEGLEHYDLGYLETVLEGQYRPGHFQGVCQVMKRLLDLVQPHQLFMGLKDYQQCMVVKRLLEHMQSTTQFIACPTMREPDGLAMSSRNLRLSPQDRQKAPAIYQTLLYIKEQLRPGNLEALKQQARERLVAAGFSVDYVEIAHAETLELLSSWDGARPLVALVAAWLGDVRLIDNALAH